MAMKISELYYCKQCGNLVEVLHAGSGDIICCGETMTLIKENSTDGNPEKHLPVIKRYGNICHITVGDEPHPMLSEHHIVWIEIHFKDRVIRHYLKPGEKPETQFCGIDPEDAVTVKAYCNLHGLWITSQNGIN